MSEVEQFLKNFSRMCDSCDTTCSPCALGFGPSICCKHPDCWDEESIRESINAVNSWAEQHPVKSRLDDLLEKYPDFDLRNGYPMFYPRVFGYCQYECIKCNAYERGIEYCWNLPL